MAFQIITLYQSAFIRLCGSNRQLPDLSAYNHKDFLLAYDTKQLGLVSESAPSHSGAEGKERYDRR